MNGLLCSLAWNMSPLRAKDRALWSGKSQLALRGFNITLLKVFSFLKKCLQNNWGDNYFLFIFDYLWLIGIIYFFPWKSRKHIIKISLESNSIWIEISVGYGAHLERNMKTALFCLS